MEEEQVFQQLQGFDPRYLFKDALLLQPGTGDFIVGGDALQVLGRMAAYYVSFLTNENRRYLRGVTVIAPPQIVWNETDDTIRAALVRGMEDVQGNAISPHVVSQFLSRVKIIRCERLDAVEISNQIAMTGNRQVVLIPHANRYRDDGLVQKWTLGRSGVLLQDDIWVPHAARVAAACIAAIRTLGSVVVFSVTDESLVRENNRQILVDVEGLFPVFAGSEAQSNDDELFAEVTPRVLALATAGRIDQALNELEQVPLIDSVKQQLILQIVARARDFKKTLSLLQKFVTNLDDLPGEVTVQYGKMAYTSGDAELALKFFATGIDKLNDQRWLETALELVTSMGATDLVERCWSRLQTLFAHSKMLEENREYRLLQICDSTWDPKELGISRVGFDEFHTYIADGLHQNQILDYQVLFEQVRLRWSDQIDLAAICIASHAFGRKNFESTIEFAMMLTDEAKYERHAVRVLIGAVGRMFLLEISSLEGTDTYKIPLMFIFRYLSRHPNEARFRADLNSLFSVEAAGSVGLQILAAIVLELTSQGARLQDRTRPKIAPADQEDFKDFFLRAMVWMSAENVIELGVTRLPVEIVGDCADRLIENLRLSIQFATRDLETAEDLELFKISVHLVCLLQPYASSGSADLDALRLLGAKYWLHGQSQLARDIAEQALDVAGESSERQRLAWGHFADIYCRMRNPVDALIGLACAAVSDAKLEAADLFQEAYTLLRVTRDLHLYTIARAVLPGCRRLYEIQGAGELGQQRLDGIEIGLDVAQSGTLDKSGLLALLERASMHCETVMNGNDELFSSAAQFMQVAGGLERAGMTLPDNAVALRASLNRRLGPETMTFFNSISVAFPSVDEVVWLHNRLGAATHSEDISSDQLSVVMAAHRLLLPRTPEISARQAAVAIELLSDRGLEIDSPIQPLLAQWPVDTISSISQAGVGVLMLATDSNGEVVVLLAENGVLQVVRPHAKERNFIDRVNAWSTKYPYRYGIIDRDDGNDEFYTSMQEFDLPMPNTEQVLVVAEPTLQQLAFNLLLINGEFAGESKAIGLAPSLTWFDSSRKRCSAKDRERLAWISCSPKSEAYGTLEMLFARLEPVFEQYGVKVDISGTIPKNLSGASLAIVTAHGGLTSERRYIHSIADEQELTESPSALARALAGVDVVILFVCSGGRVDRHPLSNTTVSLPKMLLDRGCRAVLASPWPLSSSVPGNWLERFMEAWESGDSILKANFKANRYVQERLGSEPGLALAMMAYGDVLHTKGMEPG